MKDGEGRALIAERNKRKLNERKIARQKELTAKFGIAHTVFATCNWCGGEMSADPHTFINRAVGGDIFLECKKCANICGFNSKGQLAEQLPKRLPPIALQGQTNSAEKPLGYDETSESSRWLVERDDQLLEVCIAPNDLQLKKPGSGGESLRWKITHRESGAKSVALHMRETIISVWYPSVSEVKAKLNLLPKAWRFLSQAPDSAPSGSSSLLCGDVVQSSNSEPSFVRFLATSSAVHHWTLYFKPGRNEWVQSSIPPRNWLPGAGVPRAGLVSLLSTLKASSL